jgi:hypothetical protein
LERAVYLTCRETGKTSVFLFQLDGFYIEIFFLQDNDELYSIRSFETTDQLNPYLSKIDVQSLMRELG